MIVKYQLQQFKSRLVISFTAPSGPPTSVEVQRIGSRILQIFWKPPEQRKQNGVIIGYRLCLKEKRFYDPCRNYVTFSVSAMNMYTVKELKPYTMYNIHIEAKTIMGYGGGQYLDYRTGEAGKKKFKNETNS